MSWDDLKKSMSSDFKRLQQEMEKQQSGKKESYDDPRFWSLERDKAGNGSAVIRFLPAGKGEQPAVKYWNHHFQAKGGWLIENCPTTITGQKCPVCEANNELWEESNGDDAHPSRKIARDRKRKLNYVSNILVVSDPANPDNNGKVFLFKYGKMIYDKIVEVMTSKDPDEPAFNPFDPVNGANFKLKAMVDKGYVTYKESRFSPKSAMCDGDDAKAKKLWETRHSLEEFVDPKNFKSYEELQSRLNRVLKNNGAAPKAEVTQPTEFRSKMTSQEIDEDVEKRFGKAPTKKDDQPPFTPTKTSAKAESAQDEDEEDAMSYFRKLAEED
jgi:hypothetical protein